MASINPAQATPGFPERHQALDATLASIPFVLIGSTGSRVVFLHANGYPPECYWPFLAYLADGNRVWAMRQRPLWPGSQPGTLDSWHLLSDDLLRFLDQSVEGRVVAVGHSMGAIVALRAAMRVPNRFSGLVLLDPVLVSKGAMVAWRLLRKLGTGHRLHSRIRTARRRRRSFVDTGEAYRVYRQRGVFRYLPDDALRTTVDGLLAPDPDGGYSLRYSPEWESRLYYTAIWNDDDLWDGLPKLSVPTLIVRGAASDTLSNATCQAARRRNPRIRIAALEGTSHLVPLEQPAAVYETIRSFLRELAAGSGQGAADSSRPGNDPLPLHD